MRVASVESLDKSIEQTRAKIESVTEKISKLMALKERLQKKLAEYESRRGATMFENFSKLLETEDGGATGITSDEMQYLVRMLKERRSQNGGEEMKPEHINKEDNAKPEAPSETERQNTEEKAAGKQDGTRSSFNNVNARQSNMSHMLLKEAKLLGLNVEEVYMASVMLVQAQHNLAVAQFGPLGRESGYATLNLKTDEVSLPDRKNVIHMKEFEKITKNIHI